MQPTYKAVLRYALDEKIKQGRKINLAKLAAACGVQNTYLSKVLNHDAQLNSDQVYLACRYLDLNKLETEYIFLLLEHERSFVEDRKTTLQQQIDKMRAEALKTENFISVDTYVNKELHQINYHLNPTTQLVHMYLCISKYASNEKLIAEELNISKDMLDESLDELVKLGLATKEKNAWQVSKEEVHLSKTSDLYKPYRALIRAKTLDKLMTSNNPEDYSFSAYFTSDLKTKNLIQEQFLEFLKSVQTKVQKSQSENVYQINFDLMKWSK